MLVALESEGDVEYLSTLGRQIAMHVAATNPVALDASGVDAATAELEALGFDVDTEESGSYIGLGYVLSTDPSAGEMVPRGSTITLFLV